MPPVECLRLKHVLQTVSALEAVILRCFGPEGGQVLFTRDTGQAMLSRSGTRVITALRLEHPLARVVVDCVQKHSMITGDGSKAFILLLTSLLREIHGVASKEPNVSRTYNSRESAEASTARRLTEELLAFALERLYELITVGVVPHGCRLLWQDVTAKKESAAHSNTDCIQKLLASFFHTRLGRSHSDFMGDLICKLLTHWKFRNDLPSLSLQFIKDNFPALHTPVSGFPVSCSRLIEGQIIHRDFATRCLHNDHQLVKAVAFTGYLQPKLLNAGDILELGAGTKAEKNIMKFSAWAERSLECVIANLKKLGVSVLLCAVKQSDAVLALATQAEMWVVECISEDELSLFTHLSGVTPVSDCWMIQPQHVATLTFARPILLGADRFVHVSFHDSTEEPHSIVICGPGEGLTDQYACAFQDAIRMLLTTWEPIRATTSSETLLQSSASTSSQRDPSSPDQTHVWEPGCIVPAGGTFEFLLHHLLLQHGCTHLISNPTNTGVPVVFELLAKALLSIPQQIYSHSPRRFLQIQTMVLSSVQNPSQPLNFVYKHVLNIRSTKHPDTWERQPENVESSMYCYGEADVASHPGFESVSCKYQLLLAVLQCLTTLLRVDAVMHTHTGLHTQRITSISSENSDNEE